MEMGVEWEFDKNKIAYQDVQRAAAEDGGGAAEEGGEHQAHLRVPGGGGHQGEPGHHKTQSEY